MNTTMTFAETAAAIDDGLAASAFKPAWQAALQAMEQAPEGQKDEAIDVVMAVESAIDAAPVRSMEDAATKLRLALVTASRQGVDDDPIWILAGETLAFLEAGR